MLQNVENYCPLFRARGNSVHFRGSTTELCKDLMGVQFDNDYVYNSPFTFHLHRLTLTTRPLKKSKRTLSIPTKTLSQKHSTPSTCSWLGTVSLDLSNLNHFNKHSRDNSKCTSIMIKINMFVNCLCQNYAHVLYQSIISCMLLCLLVCVL